MEEGQDLQNGIVRTSINLLSYKNKNTGQVVKINFFRTLEINQDLQPSGEHLFKKNCWALVKETGLWYLNTHPVLISSMLTLITSSRTIQVIVKTTNLAATRGNRLDLRLLKMSHPLSIVIVNLSCRLLAKTHYKWGHCWYLVSELTLQEKLYPRAFVKNYQEQLLNTASAWCCNTS